MIVLETTEEQLNELHDHMLNDENRQVRKKCMIVYLREKGFSCQQISDLVKVDKDTVTNTLKKYRDGGLQRLLANHYHKPESQLESHIEPLKTLFADQPPHTVNQASEMIFKLTGIRLKHSGCQAFMKKIGLKCRRCGLAPGKSANDPEQQRIQKDFHDQQLQPRLEETKQGKRTVLFVDAAHFVMGAFLGVLWCFTRVLLPSASGRKRYNVLGAYDPMTHEVIAVTNDTYVNQQVFCELLTKIAACYTDSGRPITLVLDNARYQKCQCVAEKAKELGIELLYLPPYSPNLNLIERLWRFVKKEVLYSTHYDNFKNFKASIDTCLAEISTCFRTNMESLMTMNFQLFGEKSENLGV